jgi:hypothetical protein
MTRLEEVVHHERAPRHDSSLRELIACQPNENFTTRACSTPGLRRRRRPRRVGTATGLLCEIFERGGEQNEGREAPIQWRT